MNPTFAGLPIDPPKQQARLSRTAVITVAVVALHAGVLWALQSGLLMRTAELIVPVELLAQFIAPPEPVQAQIAPAQPVPPAPQTRPVAAVPKKTTPRPTAQAKMQPLATPDPAPSTNAPADSLPPGPVVAQAPAVPAAPTAPAAVELPSSNADYLQNPKPAYPPLSKRLGEQGKVIVRVLIGVDGIAKTAEIRQSSSFERLDQAALNTVLKWRYVPGKRAGVAEDMWFNVPINFVLE